MDHHLNLFCSYNESNQFIENNLTRAWILSLRMLSSEVRNRFLKILLTRGENVDTEELPDFSGATFALQGNMDKTTSKRIKRKTILAIATNRLEENLEGVDVGQTNSSSGSEESDGRSIPDAWIYDKGLGYIYLVESKIGKNPLTSEQLTQEARDWFGLRDASKHTLQLTWEYVLEAMYCLKQAAEAGDLLLNNQEKYVLDALKEYLSLYGYRLFGGFKFDDLQDSVSFSVLPQPKRAVCSFTELCKPPKFYLTHSKDSNS